MIAHSSYNNSRIFDRITVNCMTGMADSEIIIKAMTHGMSIKEVGVKHLQRKTGKAVFQNIFGLVKPSVVIGLIKDMIKVYRDVNRL